MTEFLHKGDKRFLVLVPMVLDVEGGYVNNPKDPGGPTNHGIAYNYNASILRDLFGIERADMHKLTVEQAKEIYYRKYWLTVDGPAILDTAFAYVIFDCSVNQGPGRAQKILSTCPDSKKFAGDGKNVKLYRSLRREAIRLRNRSYAVSKNWATFGWGWMNRMCDVACYAERLAGSFAMVAGIVRLTYAPPDDAVPVIPVEYQAYEAA